MVVIPIFPTPITIFEFDCGNETRGFLETAPLFEEGDDNYGSISKDTYILDSEECAPLRSFILQSVKKVYDDVMCYNVDDIALLQSWISHKNKNQSHTKHKHPNSAISGVYYWEDYENKPPITFYRPEIAPAIRIPYKQSSSEFSWSWYNIQPKKNTLVIFPSYLEHSVGVNSSNYTRKSLAFNTMPKKSIGIDYCLDELQYSRLL